MTGPQFWLFGVASPLACAGIGVLCGWLLAHRRIDAVRDAAYDTGWDNCKHALGFGTPAKIQVTEPGPPAGRRPGRHASTQLPDPPRAAGTAALPPVAGGDNIGRKTS